MLYFILWAVFLTAVVLSFVVAMVLERRGRTPAGAVEEADPAPEFADSTDAEMPAEPVAVGADDGFGDFGGGADGGFADDAGFEDFK